MKPFFNKVTIIGVGLLGGSAGLALKARGLCGKVTGVGRSRSSMETGLKIGAIDEAVPELPRAAAEADLIMVCTPVGTVAEIVAEIESSIKEDCFITDVGSTKQTIVEAVEELVRAGPRFVGSHPLTGSEKKGVEHASANLFEGATIFVTPTVSTDPDVAGVVKEMWDSLGGKVIEVEPHAHDRIVARTSHLPHIVASLLVAGLRMLEPDPGTLVGKGFLDTTRVAASDPEMWANICTNNIEEIQDAMHTLRNDLEAFDEYLGDGDYERLFEFFRAAKQLRDSLERSQHE